MTSAGQVTANRHHSRIRRSGAVHSVELLLLLPILLLVLFGCLQLSFLFAANQRLHAAANAACRVASLPMSDHQEQERLAREAAEKVLKRKAYIESYEFQWNKETRTGDIVKVELSMPMKRAAPNLVGSLLGTNQRELRASVSMRRE